jgi:FtsH-binding integral membrane protein
LFLHLLFSSLSLVAANSPSDQFLWMAGPLSMGLGAIIVASLGSMFFPAARFAGMAYNLSLYGGLAVFSGFVLYDTSRYAFWLRTFLGSG